MQRADVRRGFRLTGIILGPVLLIIGVFAIVDGVRWYSFGVGATGLAGVALGIQYIRAAVTGHDPYVVTK